MNQIIPALLLFLFSIAPSSGLLAQEEIPYPVKEIDPTSEKFDRVYQLVSKQLYEDALAKMDVYNVHVLQTIEPGFYRVLIGETSYAMKIPGKPIADDEIVELPAVETDEVYQYTTVLGATATIKVATVPDLPEKLTKDQFHVNLSNGKTYLVQIGTMKINCTRCGGFGMTSSINKTKCKNCAGEGHFIKPKMFRVQW
ncbi:MAG: hypothetical protein P1U87_20005 [Verrucomicrobiales bacterium]|nr:hypothetical protein [Verrucomicrobiales bacterium]